MFLDEVTITVRAGDGGDGAATFRREAHVPRGGPDGGDGGRGGSVYLQVDAGETMLRDYRHKHHFRAASGTRGEGSKRHGKAGGDLHLSVPPGTVVRDAQNGDLLADLVTREQSLMVARGGRGGLGNVHFATSINRAPTHAQKGEPGEERRLQLELRLIADVGLVGLPNAGKSTLLGALSAATPQVAAYPFTTLTPNLGVLDFAAIDPADERRVTIADMPGLIEGASSGAGLGHAFLRHVVRTRVLGHVVDLAAADPERDYQVIREELAAHDARLLDKVSVVIGNKIDLPEGAANKTAFARRRTRDGIAFVAISAEAGTGIKKLIVTLAGLLPDAATLSQPGEPAGVVVHRFKAGLDAFEVSRENDAYRVVGRRIERLAAQTNFDNAESAERFQRDLARLGIERELVKAGVVPGDSVLIGGVELEWGDELGVRPVVSTTRWGILGGIFDPIHYAHLAVAQQAREALDLAGVLFVPAGQPVHRGPASASAEDRLCMVELAIADNLAFAASRSEIDRPGPSYMVDTLEAMHAHESDPNLVLIVSAETVALMPTTWSRVERVLELADVAVVNRQGFADIEPAWLAEHFPGMADRFHLLHTSHLGHSSTDIRARVAAGRSIRYLVPPAVESYIGEHHLYATTEGRI